jgi:hypothetical protein
MQYNYKVQKMIQAYEGSCISENPSPFGEGTQNTHNNNENKCGYGVVLLVMTEQMLMTLNDHICHAHAITGEDRHMNLTNFIQEQDTLPGRAYN